MYMPVLVAMSYKNYGNFIKDLLEKHASANTTLNKNSSELLPENCVVIFLERICNKKN